MDIECDACAQCGALASVVSVKAFRLTNSETFPLCGECASRIGQSWPEDQEKNVSVSRQSCRRQTLTTAALAESDSVEHYCKECADRAIELSKLGNFAPGGPSLSDIFDDLEAFAQEVGVALDMLADRVPVTGETETDALVDHAIRLDAAHTAFEELAERMKMRLSDVKNTLANRFIDAGTQSVTRAGKTVYLAREYWPGPDVSSFLPPGATEDNPDYAATVARCKAAAKDKLIAALKESANHAHLVSENYNSQSLRSAFAGEDAPRDKMNVPILPPEFVGLLKLNPRDVVRLRSSSSKSRR